MTSQLSPITSRLMNALEFIKFSHTLFALPFALIGMLVAARGWPESRIFLWILVCMVGGRTAAMCFNRLVDWNLDQENPRTENRHRLLAKLPAQILMLLSMATLVFGAMRLNTLCVLLSPFAIVLITFYSITKRFTAYSHLFLGLALSAAPMGAWAAVRGELWSLEPYVLALAVLCWVGGFDIIYATMDMDFDRAKGLNSIPARYGVARSLIISRILHGMAACCLGLFGWLAGLTWVYLLSWLLVCVALVMEHRLSSSSHPDALNKAFFQVNAAVSVILFVGVYLSLT
jgi:4-hydroxybenzoate polyprenyltransferase